MAGSYGYDDSTLLQVINSTDSALGQMDQVNKQVLGISGQLPVVNNSTSGMKLSARLGDWYYEFGQVITALQQLKDKANSIMQTNRSVQTDSAASS